MGQSRVDRINELARLAKERELTAQEKAERDVLRKEYLEGFRANLRQTLENTYIREADGTEHKLQLKKDK